MRNRHCAILLLLCSAAPAALADGAREQARIDDRSSTELIDAFSDLCLVRFPDEAAVRDFALGPDTAIMPADDLARLRSSGQGVYRLLRTRLGAYDLAVETAPAPPSCLVARDYAAAPVFRPYFGLALGLWALRQHATLTERESKKVFVGGEPIETVLYGLTRPDGGPEERIYATVADAPGGGATIQLVREITAAGR